MSQPETAGSTPAQATSRLGDTLRQVRRARRLTLKALASSVDCSESMLSKIERGRAQPSLRLLHALAAMLHVKVAALLADQAPGPVTIRRPGERLQLLLSSPQGGRRPVILERAVPFAEGMLLDANIHRIPPGGGSEGQYEHDAEEVGYVVKGTFELTVDGVIYVLGEGSSFHFNSRLPHSYLNHTTEDAVIFWVNGFGS
ncbi:helix-turn-helix domain-containing protein [Paracoccus aeridis]|uniref:helix-turn-helix domain-containing protein n=1 Tax=Paracoccus aeridis TaxID=1966466 RepID=UPI0010AA2BAE|nr:XRE family transcriptional regulator [Paracoccus aeridis]